MQFQGPGYDVKINVRIESRHTFLQKCLIIYLLIIAMCVLLTIALIHHVCSFDVSKAEGFSFTNHILHSGILCNYCCFIIPRKKLQTRKTCMFNPIGFLNYCQD